MKTIKPGISKLMLLLLAIILSIALTPTTAFAVESTEKWTDFAATTYAGGTGTKDDPYLISSPEQLAKLAVDTNASHNIINDYFKLTADIDLAGKLWIPIGKHMGNNSMAGFAGHFDGNGKTISNMNVKEDSITPSGLFGVIIAAHTDYTVKELTIINSTVIANTNSMDDGLNEYVNASGVLCGYVGLPGGGNGTAIITNCTVHNNTVNGTLYSGGFIGTTNYAQISDCSVSDTIVNGSVGYVGGFIGNEFEASITNCSVTNATIQGTWCVGGFAGVTYGGILDTCTTSAVITADDWHVGGFVGYVEKFDELMEIKNCTSNATINSTVSDFEPRVGGFAGHFVSVSSVENCTALGLITSEKEDQATVGSFAGVAYSDQPILNCHYDDKNNGNLQPVGTGETFTDKEIGPYYADYTAVDQAITAANALIKENYIDFTGVTNAINAVVRDKDYTKQDEVDAMAKAINDAVDALELKAADYTSVDKAIADANALTKENYIDFTGVTNAIKAVDRNKDFTKQDEVDAMAKAINDAVGKLELKAADYTSVDKAIANANALTKGNYKDFTVVTNAINAVDYNKKITEQSEVDAMAKAINDAVGKLELKAADYTAVDKAIADANALTKGNYKDFTAVTDAINMVVYDKDITEQSVVDGFAKSINDAIAALEKKTNQTITNPTDSVEGSDYTSIDQVIAYANALKKENYKDFTAVTNAINAAIREKDLTKQDEVDALAKAINDAVNALELKGADYTSVDQAIADANALAKENYKDFTAVTNAIKAVVYGKDITEQSVVDSYAKTINAAVAALEKKTNQTIDNPADTTKPKKDTTSPKTGDHSNMTLWIALLIISCGTFSTLTIYSKRKKHHTN